MTKDVKSFWLRFAWRRADFGENFGLNLVHSLHEFYVTIKFVMLFLNLGGLF
jgi:hypothetical protein